MIDLHSHILHGIDDGAETFEDAVAMCQLAAADGTEVMVATPHRFDGIHENHPIELLRERLVQLQAAVGESIRLVLGCELHFTHAVVEQLCETGDGWGINEGPYVLLEFPPFSIPHGCEHAIYKLTSHGFRPLIAHPERNRAVQEKPEFFYNLSELGLYGQVDSASLFGKFGKEAQAAARTLLKSNLIHAISSDSHSPRRRRPGLSQAFAVARDLVGDEHARALVVDNPRAVVDGQPLPYVPDATPPRQKRSRWFSL